MAGYMRPFLVVALGLSCSALPLSQQQQRRLRNVDPAGSSIPESSELNGNQPQLVDAFLDAGKTNAHVLFSFRVSMLKGRVRDLHMYYLKYLNANWTCTWESDSPMRSLMQHSKFSASESVPGMIVSDTPASKFAKPATQTFRLSPDEDKGLGSMVVNCPTSKTPGMKLNIIATSPDGSVIYQRDHIPVSTSDLFKPNLETALCTQIVKDSFSERFLSRWVKYHLRFGFEQILVYAETDDLTWVQTSLSEFTSGGRVTIVPFYFEGVSNAKNFAMQDAMETHCLYQAKGRVKWLGHFDMDEYLQPMGAAKTINEFVQHHTEAPEEGTAAVSVRSQFWRAQYPVGKHPVDIPFQAAYAETMPCDLTCKVLIPVANHEFVSGYEARNKRSKLVMKTDHVQYYGPHMLTTYRGVVDYPDPDTELRLNHFKGFGKREKNGQPVLMKMCENDLSFRESCLAMMS